MKNHTDNFFKTMLQNAAGAEALEVLEGLLQEHDQQEITIPPDYVTTMRRLVDQWNGKGEAS